MQDPLENAGPGPTTCPICDSNAFEFLSPVWRNYDLGKEFFISGSLWFVECNGCGAVLRLPFPDYRQDFRKFGEDYYNVGRQDQSVQEHAQTHFELFQKPNYDSMRTFLSEVAPPATYPRWLDVGSIGYATTFR